MLRLLRLASAGFLAAVGVALAHAQEADPLKDVVRKAIAAHGGEKALAKYTAGTCKYKGTMQVQNLTFDISVEAAFQLPDKVRIDQTDTRAGQSTQSVTVFDGKSLWHASAGKTVEIKDGGIVGQMRQSLLFEGGGLLEILKAPYELFDIGNLNVKGKDTIGIRVSKKGEKDINYFFDKKTHLIAKIDTRTLDPFTGFEVTEERFFIEYQDKGPFKADKRIEVHVGGNPYLEFEVTEVRVLDKLDDNVFMQP